MSAGFNDDQDRLDMQQLAAGDEDALNRLMGRYSDRLFRFLLRALQNETDASDLAEEAFVRVYQHRQRFDPRQKFSTWLYAIAANLARDKHRWRQRRPEVPLHSDDASRPDWLTQLPDSTPTPGENAESTERADAVRRAIAELPEELRTALILSEYEGLSHAEVAQVLECSAKAVEMRLYRARQQLREQLNELLSQV